MTINSDWFKNVKEVSVDDPELKGGLIVEKVAHESPGQNIGLKAGD